MALTNAEAAALAASNVTTRQLPAVAAKYKTWLDAQDTQATAVLALIMVSKSSKSPDVVIAKANAEYARIEADPASITSVTRTGGATAGAQAGGTVVSIVGKDLTEVTSVTFGGTPGTSLTHVDDEHITVTTPAHAAGAVAVVAVSPNGNGTLNNGYTYV